MRKQCKNLVIELCTMGAVNDQLLLHTTRMKCRPVTKGAKPPCKIFHPRGKLC